MSTSNQMPIKKPIMASNGDRFCDKCKKNKSVYKLGHKSEYGLCQKCMEAWKKFRETTRYAQQMDNVYGTPKFTSVWLDIFHVFLGGKYISPEKVQFT